MRQKIENGVMVKARVFDQVDKRWEHVTGLWIDNTLTITESGNGFGTYSKALLLVGKKFVEVNHDQMELLEDSPMTRTA